MKRLLLVATIPETLEAFFLAHAVYFQAKGWRVDGMAHRISKATRCREVFDRVWDVEWSRNPLDPRNVLASYGIRERVKRERYDVVHVFTPVAAFVTRYALRGLDPRNRPSVVYTALGFHFYRGCNALKKNLFVNLERLAGRWTDYLVVVNREDEDAARHYKFVPADRVRFSPSGIGVDLNRFNQNEVSDADVGRVRRELGLHEQSPLFLSVADLTPRKHPQDVVRAFARLNRTDAHLALAGDGPMLPQVQRLAVELHVNERVHCLGYRRDVPVLIRAAVAVILASEQEGLPISVIESLCMETPVIGTDIRGTRDLLRGGGGFLVPRQDIDRMAQAMADVLDDPEQARQMGRRGREHMKAYDLQHVLALQEALYTEITQSTTEPIPSGATLPAAGTQGEASS